MSKKKKNKFNENLRLVVMNENTFEEKYSFRLNLKNLYILLSSLIVVLFILMFIVISFTPLKHIVPGYGNIENNSYVIKLNRYITELEANIETQEHYNKSLRKILVENDTTGTSNFKHYNKDNSKKSTISVSPKETNKNTQLDGLKNIEDINFISPLRGKINKKIDVKIGHYGIDIAGPKNAPIKSIAKGTVIFSDWSPETGNTIIIQHANNLLSVYKHNSSLLKEIGDFVNEGEAIALIGNTGTLTDGPHLHFELWYKSIPLDPLKYINIE